MGVLHPTARVLQARGQPGGCAAPFLHLPQGHRARITSKPVVSGSMISPVHASDAAVGFGPEA